MAKQANPKKTDAKQSSPRSPKAQATTQLDTEKTALRALVEAGDDNDWQKGVHYNAIVDGNLAVQGGFKNAHDFFASEFADVSQASLTVYGRVAERFAEPVAKQYGCTKLNDLVVYLKAKQLPVPTGDPGATLVDVPQADGSTASKQFSDCSDKEIKTATAASGTATPLPAATQTRQAAFDAALTALLGKKNKLEMIPKLKNGEVVWTLHGDMPDGLASTILGTLKDH